jgi:uncharacterized membrane protein
MIKHFVVILLISNFIHSDEITNDRIEPINNIFKQCASLPNDEQHKCKQNIIFKRTYTNIKTFKSKKWDPSITVSDSLVSFDPNQNIDDLIPKKPIGLTFNEKINEIKDADLMPHVDYDKIESFSQIPFADQLLNNSYIVEAAQHGIHYVKRGKALVFHKKWEQLFIFPNPKNIPIVNEFIYNDICSNIDTHKAQVVVDFFNGAVVPESFNYKKLLNDSGCHLIETKIKNDLKLIKDSIDEIYNDFKVTENLRRRKREPITLIALVAGAALATSVGSFIGVLMGRSDTAGLAKEIRKNDEKIAFLANQLLSVSFETDQLRYELKTDLQNLEQNIKASIDSIRKTLEHHINVLTLDNLQSFLTLSQFIHLQSVSITYQNAFSLLIDYTHKWKNIFTVLRTGRLPPSLLSWDKLKTHLYSIKSNLKSHEFAINIDQWNLYYRLPITDYWVFETQGADKEIWVNLKIPLKIKNSKHEYDIIIPHYRPFPCTSCGEGTLLAIENNKNVWLIDKTLGTLEKEANIDEFTCINTIDDRVCYTYHPHLMSQPSACSKALFEWNVTNIIKWCTFTIKSNEEYYPIPINQYSYVFHKQMIKEYELTCSNNYQTKTLQNWTEIVSVPSLCTVSIPNSDIRIIGPTNVNEIEVIKIEHNTLHSDLLKEISNTLNNSYIPINITYNYTHIKDIQFDLQFNNKMLTRVSQRHEKMVKAINDELERLKLDENNLRSKSMIFTFLSNIFDILIIIGIIILLCTCLRLTSCCNWLVPSIALSQPQRVNAISLNNTTQIIEKYMYSFGDYLSILLSICFIIIIIITIKRNYFYGVKVHTNIGYVKRDKRLLPSLPWTLILNLYGDTKGLFTKYVELNYIRYPIININNDRISNIIITNHFNLWYVGYKNNIKCLRLAEKIHIIGTGTNGERIIASHIDIDIPLSDIKWDYHPKPKSLYQIKNYNIVSVSVRRDRKITE